MSCVGLKVDESFMQKFSLWITETAEHFPQDLWDGFNQKEWEEFTLNTHFSGIQNPIKLSYAYQSTIRVDLHPCELYYDHLK